MNQTGAQAAVAALNPANGEQTAVTPNSSTADAFELPQRVAVLPDGNLLVADYALNDLEGGLVHVERTTGAARILRQGTLFNNPLGLALVVNRAPAATIRLVPGKVAGGEWVTFDAAGSSDPEGLPLRYAWDLNGDGSFESSTGAVPRARSRFGSSTTLTPRVRVMDPHGGDTVAASASPLVVDAIRPVISGFRASRAPDRPVRRPGRGRAGAGRPLPLPAVGAGARADRDPAGPDRPPQGPQLRGARPRAPAREALHALAHDHEPAQARGARTEQHPLRGQGARPVRSSRAATAAWHWPPTAWATFRGRAPRASA